MTNLSGENLTNGAAAGPQDKGMDSLSTFPKYSAYKDSEVEWAGTLPAEWQVLKLKRAARLQSGEFITSEAIEDDAQYPVYGGNGLRGYTVDYTHDGEFALIGRQGALCGNINYAEGKFWASEHAVVVYPEKGIVTRWLGELLRSMNLGQYSVSAAQPGLSVERIADLLIPMPSQAEQTQIARLLDHETARIDALIEEQQHLIELLKEKRQAVISHAVIKGLDPTVPMKDSGVEWLGEVPAHWSVVPFGLAFGYQEGPGIMAVDFRDEGVPLVRISGVQGRWVTLQGCNYLDPAKASGKWGHFRLEYGDLIISGSASMGLVSEVGEEAVGAVAYTGLIRLTPKAGISDRDFIRSVVGSYQFFVQIDLLKAGSTIQHFGPTHLSQMKVVLPPLDEQIKLASYVDKVSVQFDQLLGEAEKTNELLQERRSALISAAVTGKIDVRGWLPPASASTPELE